MKTIVSFVAYRRSAYKPSVDSSSRKSVSCELSDDAFKKLCHVMQKHHEKSIEISLDEDSLVYKKALDLIYSHIGKRPSEFVGVGVRRGTEFLVNRKNHYTEAEIAEAPALLVIPSPNLVKLIGMEDGLPAYKSSAVRKKEFGALFPTWRMGVTDELAESLKSKNLIGLGLMHMKDIERSRVTTRVHWIKPTIRLPRCKLQLCDNRGNPITEPNGWHQIMASSTPMELVYDSHAFALAGDFDLAFTHESPGSGDLIGTPLLVVSQNFRAILKSRGCDGVDFTPVKLV